MIGAILTQNTAWRNVEHAIRNLHRAGALDFDILRKMPVTRLARLIRPSGTYRVKANRIKSFISGLDREGGGSLEVFLEGPMVEVRNRLLRIDGIGPETADAILLYAADQPAFVVDAYTRRVLRRHGVIEDQAAYDDVARLFYDSFSHDARLFNEQHALFVQVGKTHCGVRARCSGCPLEPLDHDPEG